MDDDGFMKVPKRKAGRKTFKPLRKENASLVLLAQKGLDAELDLEKSNETRIGKLLLNYRNEIKLSALWEDNKEVLSSLTNVRNTTEGVTLPGISTILCYGIGNPLECPDSRYQLSFALLLKELLQVEQCEVYDPCLTRQARKILSELGFTIIQENEECRRVVQEGTLFFMIHCGLPMYENVIASNYGTELRNVAILGNSFSSYETRLPSEQLRRKAPYLFEIADHVIEIPMKNSFRHYETFVNTSLHFFPVGPGASDVIGQVSDTRRHLSDEEADIEMIRASSIPTFVDSKQDIPLSNTYH